METNEGGKYGLEKIASDLTNFLKEVKKEGFFKALSKLWGKKKEELTEEQKKTQENLNKLSAQLIDANFSDLEDSIYGIKTERNLEQDLQNEESILGILSENESVKSWFMWFTSGLDDGLNIGGRTGKEIKADGVEFVLLAAKKLSDDDDKQGADLTLQDLEILGKKLGEIKEVCEGIKTTSGKPKEQVLAVCIQKLKDKLKANDYDITKLTKAELENELKNFDDNPDSGGQLDNVENQLA